MAIAVSTASSGNPSPHRLTFTSTHPLLCSLSHLQNEIAGNVRPWDRVLLLAISNPHLRKKSVSKIKRPEPIFSTLYMTFTRTKDGQKDLHLNYFHVDPKRR